MTKYNFFNAEDERKKKSDYRDNLKNAIQKFDEL